MRDLRLDTIAFVTLDEVADRAAEVADLDGQARGRVRLDQELGQSVAVLATVVIETRTPLPADVLKDVRAGAPDWFRPPLRSMILDAVTAQEAAR